MKLFHFTKVAILIFLIVISVVSFWAFLPGSLSAPNPQVLGSKTARPSHKLFNFSEDLFYQGVNGVAEKGSGLSYKVYGGVVTHHLLASRLIAGFFSSLKSQNPKTIIILGPNHWDVGKSKTLTGYYGWETPFGVLETNEKKINKLVVSGIASEDDLLFANEHSVGALVPYIKYYLPDAKVVPIILKPSYELKDSLSLAGALKDLLDEDTVLVSSVDFSHYLKNSESEQKDVVSLEAIKREDLEKIFSFNNDNLDCPGCIATLLLTMGSIQRSNFEVLDHTNSGKILGTEMAPTTSYFLIAFH